MCLEEFINDSSFYHRGLEASCMANLLQIAQRHQYRSFSVLIYPCLCVSLLMYPNLSLLIFIYLYLPLSMLIYLCLSIYQRHKIPWATLRIWGNDIKQDYVRKREVFNPHASFHHQMAQQMMVQSKTLAEIQLAQKELMGAVQQLQSMEIRRSIDDESFRTSMNHAMTQLIPTKRRGPIRSPVASTATFQVSICIFIYLSLSQPYLKFQKHPYLSLSTIIPHYRSILCHYLTFVQDEAS
jgi:hypothetical protein